MHIMVSAVCTLKRLNRLQMRVLRRITDCISGVSDGPHRSNVAVRRMVGEPCVDCILLRSRLCYAKRVVEHGPAQLHALLWNNGSPTEWAKQVQKDIVFMQSVCGKSIGHNMSPWDVLLHTPRGEWKDATSKILGDESAADPSVEIVGAGGSVLSAQTFCCFACVAGDEERSAAPQFKSLKALQSHQRVKHGIRSPMRFFASGSGVCPACHTNFRQRLRLLAHLCDSRRPICRDKCLDLRNEIEPISFIEVSRLDLADRAARTAAAKQGHSHAIAVGEAVRSDGKAVGRTTS